MKSKSTFSILFFLRQERENKNGAPLMLRVTINGKSAKTSLGIRVPSKDWDVKRSRCRMREPEREGIEPSEILYFTVVMSF